LAEALEERLLRDLADRGGVLQPPHRTTDLSWPKRILRSSSVRVCGGCGFTSFAFAYARPVAGRARIAAFQRFTFGNSSMSCPCRSGMIQGYAAMSAMEYCLPRMKLRPRRRRSSTAYRRLVSFT